MNIRNKLKELKPHDLNCNVFDVYSYDGLTMQELLCQFFTIINECVNVSNNTLDLTEWLVNEGLKEEVANKLLLWYEDGTLEKLINITLFENLNNKIDTFKSEVDSQLEHIEKHLNINVLDFGAIGDGVYDDTEAFTNAISSIPNGKKTVLIIPQGYKFNISEVVIDKTYVTICGGGEIINGCLYLNYPTKTECFIHIEKITFTGDKRAHNTCGVKFNNSRRVTIQNCNFNNMDKALHVPSHIGYLQNGNDILFHSVGMLNINNNQFNNVNYAIYIDYNTDEVNDNVALDERWMRVNDVHFINNFINVMYVTSIWCRGVDGVVISNNTIFSPSSNKKNNSKINNIYIGATDWLIINGNNLFEAGCEAIKIDSARRITITGNSIAWCGQRFASSAIVINGDLPVRGAISGNTISLPTKHGIEINAIDSELTITGNHLQHNNTSVPDHYYGDTNEITSIKHYNIISKGYGVAKNNWNARLDTKFKDSLYEENFLGVTTCKITKTVEVGTGVKLGGLSNKTSSNANTPSGIVNMLVRYGTGESSNSGTYVLLVHKCGNFSSVVEIAKGGLTDPTSSAATNWCGFTFSLNSDNELIATPKNQTQGTFTFNMSILGDLSITE